MASSISPMGAYLSPQARQRSFASAVERGGGTLRDYGTSVEGRPLEVAHFQRRPVSESSPASSHRGPAPAVLLSANIHGPEWISTALALHFARVIADGDNADVEALRQRTDIYIAPCLNPDGYARTWDLAGEGSVATLRTNANGVDLNRNFPIPPGFERSKLPGQGSKKKGDATYIGTGELSEPETAHLSAFLTQTPLIASANVHSFMGTTIPPRVTSDAAYREYQSLSRAFSRGQRRDRYWRLQSRLFDGFTGEMEDHQHHVHRTWAMTIECFPLGQSFLQHVFAPNTFWRFNPRDVERWTENDLPGIVSFFNAALDVGPVKEP